jgi:hypothetical protein
MGIETRYNYIYYTVLDQDWFDEAERILTTELTTERLINAIERKLKNNKDCISNNFIVDHSRHSEDIEHWININVQNKKRPVFVQIEDNQPIIKSGCGTLFVFYEQKEADDNQDSISVRYGAAPDSNVNFGSVDSLAGIGGIL